MPVPPNFRGLPPGFTPPGTPGSSYMPSVPDYLTRNSDGTYTFAEGTTNRQVVDTLRDMGVLNDTDYNWFLDWFSESSKQGNDVANKTWMVEGAGELSSEGQDWAPESLRRINLAYNWLNTYGETGSFTPSQTFSDTYGVSSQPISQPGSASGTSNMGPGYTDSGRPIFAGAPPTGGDPRAPYYTPEDTLVRSDQLPDLYADTPPPPPPPTTPPPKDLTSDTLAPEDVPPPPTETPPPDTTPPTPAEGIASALGVDLPDFGDFGAFMAQRGQQRDAEPDFENEVEREIERRAAQRAAASGTSSSSSSGSISPYMGSSIFGTGFMGISPEVIQAAIAAAREREAVAAAAAAAAAEGTPPPAQMANGGIVSLMKKENMGPTGDGIESFLMRYQDPGTVSRERKAAALRRTLSQIQPRPTAPGPIPTMQQGIMPMAG